MPVILFTMVLFTVASVLLGEVYDFYNLVWWWDLALHFTSGWMVAALIGYPLSRHTSMVPIGAFVVIVSLTTNFLFVWEIFEFYMDTYHGYTMTKTGLDDTMEDMLIGILGAVIGATASYRYLKGHRRGYFVRDLRRRLNNIEKPS